MLEFDNPYCYYEPYYNHTHSSSRKAEPISREMVKKWKRQCESEISKRGLHFHDMGHGWTAEPYGLDSSSGWVACENLNIDPEKMVHFAMLNGKRQVRKNMPLCSNVCMSNPETRRIMAKYIADYANKHHNVDFLHIWLGDESNGHCECPECQKKITSDWYVMLLNDIDDELTKQNLETHIVFIVYADTFCAPLVEKISNNKRFTMLYAPIHRSYTETYATNPDMDSLVPYERNNIRKPHGMSECLAYLYDWKNKMWTGDCFCYEYHFMDHQFCDISNLFMANIVYNDIKSLKNHGLQGIIEDGSQRSYFPTGFQFYVYGETLFDSNVTFEELKEDYFSHAFGENWEMVTNYLDELKELMRFTYFYGKESVDASKGNYYNPEMAKNAELANKLVKEFIPVINSNLNQAQRASTVAWQILELGTIYADKVSLMVKHLSVGNVDDATKELKELNLEMSKKEVYFEKYYDHYICMRALKRLVGDIDLVDNLVGI